MTDTEPTEESIRSSLAAIDAGTYKEPEEEVKPEGETEPEVKDKAPEKKAEEPKKETPEPESGSSLKSDGVKEEKPKSKYEANKERQGKTWQEINAEKEAVKAEKAAIQAEKDALKKEREEIQKARTEGQPYRDENGATAKDYREVAKQYRAKGDEAMAEAAEKLADGLVAKEQQFKVQRQQDELKQSWSNSLKKLVEKSPELNDPNSDLYKETMALLNAVKPLTLHPEGLEYAVAFAENKLKGGKYETTASENKELKQKLEALEKKLSIGSGPTASSPSDDKPFEELSEKEQEKRLRQAVTKHDREAGY